MTSSSNDEDNDNDNTSSTPNTTTLPSDVQSTASTRLSDGGVDEFQILYQHERSGINMMKTRKDANEIRLRSLLASVTESEAFVEIIRNDMAKMTPRKKVSFRQKEADVAEFPSQPSSQELKPVASTKSNSSPARTLRKFMVEDDDAISEITGNFTIGSNKSQRSDRDIPRTPVSMTNVIVPTEPRWVPKEQPMFQIKRSPANNEIKKATLSQRDLDQHRSDPPFTTGKAPTATGEVEINMSDYTAKLRSGDSQGSSSHSSRFQRPSSISTDGTSSQQVGYTQMSLSDLSSVWKWSSSSSSGGGALTTHTEESPADGVYMNLVMGDTPATANSPRNYQSSLFPTVSTAPLPLVPKNSMWGDSSDAAQSSAVYSDAAATMINSDDAVAISLPSTDSIQTVDGDCAYPVPSGQAFPPFQLMSTPNLLGQHVAIGIPVVAAAAMPAETKSEEELDQSINSSPNWVKSSLMKLKKKKWSKKKETKTGATTDVNKLAGQSGRLPKAERPSSSILKPVNHPPVFQHAVITRLHTSDKSTSDTMLFSREHQMSNGQRAEAPARLTQSDPAICYQASSKALAAGYPPPNDIESGVARLIPVSSNAPKTFHIGIGDVTADVCSVISGDPSSSKQSKDISDEQSGHDYSVSSQKYGFSPQDKQASGKRQSMDPLMASARNDPMSALFHTPQDKSQPIAAECDYAYDFHDSLGYNVESMRQRQTTNKSRKIFWCLICTLLVLACAIPIGIIAGRRTVGSGNAPSSAPSVGTTTPARSRNALVEFLSGISVDNGTALSYPGTPQYQAVSWLLEKNDPSLWQGGQRLIQRYALATLYFALGGKLWKHNENWLIDDDECLWHSESENPCEYGAIVELHLSFNGLKGSLPDEISLLESLRSLDLSGNSITRSLPGSFWQLKDSLLSLKLNNNEISGSLPSQFGELTLLETLQMSVNQISGIIPSEIGRNTNLRELQLSMNGINGTIPSEIGKLSLLSQLDLRGNSISGTLPKELFALSKLANICLDDLRMAMQTFPTEIRYLTSLTSLKMGQIGLSGSIPSQVGRMSNLVTLSLRGNNLTGSIPSAIGEASSLVVLDLSNNSLLGSLPSELGLLTNMDLFSVKGNVLTGSIPLELSNITSYQAVFDLTDNNLVGTVPAQFCEQSCCAKGMISVDVSEVQACATLSCVVCATVEEQVSMASVP